MLTEIIPKIAGMEQTEQKYRHRCSNATYGDRCIRQQIYHALGVEPKPIADRYVLVLDDSSWHEELTADWIRKSVYKLHSEQMYVEVFTINGVKVGGKIDGVLTDINGNDYLWEHKAINHFSFAGYEAGLMEPQDYVVQCVMYIVGLQKITGEYLPAILLIKNKNTSQFLEYQIKYDNKTDTAKATLYRMVYNQGIGAIKEMESFSLPNIIATAKKRFEDVDSYVAKKSVPKRQYDIADWHCQYCQFAEVCWENYEEEVAQRKENIRLGGDIAEKVLEYYKINEARKEAEKVSEKIKEELMQIMREKEIKSGIAGDFILKLYLKERSTLNKSLLPAELVRNCTQTTKYDMLTVSLSKNQK